MSKPKGRDEMTFEEKKEFCLRAEMLRERVKSASALSPTDRADAVTGLEAASMYVRSGIVRHGVSKLFCEDTASLFRHMSALKDFSGEERDYFASVAAVLVTIFPPEEKPGKKRKKK